MSDHREQKNAVFSNKQDVNVPQQHYSSPVMPEELVPLPSNGLVYPVTSPLYGKDAIEIKRLSTKEEDILTNKVLLKKGTVITELIRSCLIDKSVDPTEMIAGDRNAIMVAIRASGYGQYYDADVTCGNEECEIKSSRTFDLSKLEINRLEIEPVTPGTNVFEFTLPSNHVVKFRFLTGADEEEQTIIAERQRKAGIQDAAKAVTTNLLKSLVSVDGIEDRQHVAKFVSTMSGIDSLALRKYIKKNEPGIKMRQETTCPICDHVEEVAIPIGVTFLYPGLES